jgi:hypothetical protein
MSFEPKRRIPPIAAAGLALMGCGDDASQLQQAAERVDRLDPHVSAFCMKYVDCYPDDWFFPDLDACRAVMLGYMDAYAQLSDDPAACGDAVLSYLDCFRDAPCGDFETLCTTEFDELDVLCFEQEEAPQ